VPPAEIDLIIDGVGARRPTLTHDRVDATHSNAYEAWKRMGAPQPPTRAQYAELELAGRVQALEPPRPVTGSPGLGRPAPDEVENDAPHRAAEADQARNRRHPPPRKQIDRHDHDERRPR